MTLMAHFVQDREGQILNRQMMVGHSNKKGLGELSLGFEPCQKRAATKKSIAPRNDFQLGIILVCQSFCDRYWKNNHWKTIIGVPPTRMQNIKISRFDSVDQNKSMTCMPHFFRLGQKCGRGEWVDIDVETWSEQG